MKTKLLFILLLISFPALAVTAQQTSTGKSASETSKEAKKGRPILSFKKSEHMFQILNNGKWLYMQTDCVKAFTIKVSSDYKTIKLIYPQTEEKPEREYIYNVLEVGKYFIRTQIESEKRMTNDGKPVVWDFMFLSADEFLWHRTDWEGLNSTPPITRCKEEKQLALLN